MVQKITRTFAVFASFMLVSIVSFAQNASVKGMINDSEGKALYNASVTVEGKSKGAMSNDKGFYEIKGLTAGSYTLIYRFMGMETIKETVVVQENQALIKDVTLQSKAKDEDEVVVIGYGTSRTKDLTGAATVINEKNFVQGSLSTPEQLIMGKVAGLKVTSNDGAPGSGSTLRLRGGTSINASNDPLIVVDGVPLDNGGIAGVANPLSLINPNDIASFVVLKDASATAIYGSRAANGVIIITTKKGDGGKNSPLKIVLDTKISQSTIAKYADVLSGDSLRSLVNARGTAAQKALLGDSSTDWQKQVFRNAIMQNSSIYCAIPT